VQVWHPRSGLAGRDRRWRLACEFEAPGAGWQKKRTPGAGWSKFDAPGAGWQSLAPPERVGRVWRPWNGLAEFDAPGAGWQSLSRRWWQACELEPPERVGSSRLRVVVDVREFEALERVGRGGRGLRVVAAPITFSYAINALFVLVCMHVHVLL